MSRTRKTKRATPWYLDCQLRPSHDQQTTCRLLPQTALCNSLNRDNRGVLPVGYRCVVYAQKVLRRFQISETLLCKAATHHARHKIMQNALRRADEVISNCRTLETTLLTRFGSAKVLLAPFRQFTQEDKTMECDFAHSDVRRCARMETCRKSRFVLFYCGSQATSVICEVSVPQTFASFDELVAAAGSLDNIIHVPTLKLRERGCAEAEVMSHLYGTGGVAHGYHGARVQSTIYPWIIPGMTQPPTTARLFKRLSNCMNALISVYADLGYTHLLEMHLPDTW